VCNQRAAYYHYSKQARAVCNLQISISSCQAVTWLVMSHKARTTDHLSTSVPISLHRAFFPETVRLFSSSVFLQWPVSGKAVIISQCCVWAGSTFFFLAGPAQKYDQMWQLTIKMIAQNWGYLTTIKCSISSSRTYTRHMTKPQSQKCNTLGKQICDSITCENTMHNKH